MLYVVNVQDNRPDMITAVTHVDGTERLETVKKVSHPRYYRLIETFQEASGIPVVLNTSFNLKGEPSVNTPPEAIQTFTLSGMDALVLGDYVIAKAGDLN